MENLKVLRRIVSAFRKLFSRSLSLPSSVMLGSVTAKNLANVWMKYQVSDGVFEGLGFGAGMQYTDRRSGIWPGWNSTEGNKYLPAYTIFDAAISYTTGRFNIGLNAYNLPIKNMLRTARGTPIIRNGFLTWKSRLISGYKPPLDYSICEHAGKINT